MIDESIALYEPNPLLCKVCGSLPSVQVFGPTQYVKGTVPERVWMCSNHEKLSGTCKSDRAYMSLSNWNEGNLRYDIYQESEKSTNISGDPVPIRDNDIVDIIKYQAACKQELIKAGLWNDDLERLRNNAYHAIDRLCVDTSEEASRSDNAKVEYDDTDDSVLIKSSDGKLIYAYPDGSITVGVQTDIFSKHEEISGFTKYYFDELLNRKFEFGDITVSCKVNEHPYNTEIEHTLADGTRVVLKSNGDLFIQEPDDDYALETTIENLLKTPETLQKRKDKWMRVCFSDEITDSPQERNRRFLEESLELVQSLDMDRFEAHFMVDYVFNRDKGIPFQEVGGSILCLAALCNVHKINMMEAAETELARVWTKVDTIRGKQKQKPNFLDDLDWIVKAMPTEALLYWNERDIKDLSKERFNKSVDMAVRYTDPLASLNLTMALKEKVKSLFSNCQRRY